MMNGEVDLIVCFWDHCHIRFNYQKVSKIDWQQVPANMGRA